MKMRILFGLIFLLIISTYILCHLAVYFSAVRFFGLQGNFSKTVLAAALAFLGSSFFLSTLIAHLQDNVFSRAYYFFSGAWIGLLVNLILFFALAWLIAVLNTKFHFIGKEIFVGMSVVVLAVAYSVYGIWNAFNPVVKHLDVSIENIPDYWVGKKIVQISDVHLGHIYNEKYFSGIVDKVNSLNPDVIAITGDLFDGTDGNMEDFVESLGRMTAPDGVYFVTGNHETYLGVDKASAVLDKTNIKWLRDSLVTKNGLQFIGIDYPLRGEARNIAKLVPQISGYEKADPNILLIHEPVQIKNAQELGTALQLSGHTHRGQLFPFGFITSMIFGKYDHGFHREGNYVIYTSSGLGGWGPPMRSEGRAEIVEITLH